MNWEQAEHAGRAIAAANAAAAAQRSERARRAWATRRAIERGERPPTRPARVRVTVVDGIYAGKTLLLDRADVSRDEWAGPWGTYRFVDAVGGRIAYLDPGDPFVPVIGWRGWHLARAAVPWDWDGHLRVQGVNRTTKEVALPLLESGTGSVRWPGRAPVAAVCGQVRHVAPPTAPIPFGADIPTAPRHDPALVPITDCSCGIYMAATHHTLEAAGHAGEMVVGLLAGWGRIVHHGGGMESAAGYRVARAYPVAMILTGSPTDWTRHAGVERNAMIRDMRVAYGVPVAAADPTRVYDTMRDYVASPASLLPPWVYRCLPPDLRVAGASHDRARGGSDGGR